MRKNRAMLIGGAALLAGAAWAANEAPKAEPKTPTEERVKSEIVTLTGTISVQKNERGHVDKVQLKAGDGTVYDITPGSESKMLALEAGNTVEVVCLVDESKDVKTLLVRSFKVMQ